MPSNLSTLQTGRHTLSSAGSSDLEVAGTFVQGSGPYTGLAVQNTAYAASAFPLSVPAGATGPEELLAPLRSPPGGSCVAATTGAVNTGSGPQTYFVVFNNCGTAAPNTIGGVVVAQPIDATFKSKYVAANTTNTLPEYSLEIGTPDVHPSATSTWYVLLYNRVSSSWEIVYTQRGLSATTYGYSVYYSVFQPGQCPTGLPNIASDAIQLYNPSGATLSAANTSGSGSTTVNFTPGTYGNANCFTADATGPATDTYTMVSANTDWTVSKKLVPSGTFTEYSIPTANAGPEGIAAGPDGNLWFTENNNNRIGKITPSGTVTEYKLPASAAIPEGIAAGPDGNLWFTEASADNSVNRVGKITPSGSFAEYPLSASSASAGITAGPDGNMWFTENYATHQVEIGKITTGGAITEYPVPTGNYIELYGIAAGPDGNLWFTESYANKIGKMTPNGRYTEYAPSSGVSGTLYGIAAGPDGNLWFAELSSNNIGKITPSGSSTEYPIPASRAFPYGIAAGPDGNLWFTEQSANKIGKITP